MPETKRSLMRRFKLVELRSPETAAAFAIFQQRTSGFLEVAWRDAWSPATLQKAFDQYGFDCYTQGCVDGATTAMMRPEVVDFMRTCSSEPQEPPR